PGGEPSPLTTGLGEGLSTVERIEHEHEAEQIERLGAWRAERDAPEVVKVLDQLKTAAADPASNLLEVSIEAARAGVTTGEWAGARRAVFGEYGPPTGA